MLVSLTVSALLTFALGGLGLIVSVTISEHIDV